MARFRLALAALAVLACGCASAQKPYNPFVVPRESFYPGLKTIALAPVGLPSDVEDPEPVRAWFSGSIAAKLKDAGFAVVPASEVGSIMGAKIKEAGGLFDPVTGKVDEVKARAVNAAVGRELKARFNADALLTPSIRVVSATVKRDEAEWDGATEGAGKGGFWKAFMTGTHSGSIGALSLAIRVADPCGRILYVNRGGIQVLGKVNSGGKVEARPRSELFTDGERNAKAVQLALDPLLVGTDSM